MTDTPVEAVPPADAPAADTPVSEPQPTYPDGSLISAPAPETAAQAPVVEGGPPVPDQATRDAVSAAGDTLAPGQTVTTSVNKSDVRVTGTPASDPDAPADHTISEHGESVLIDTPLGRVEVRVEVDSEGSFATVAVTVTGAGNAIPVVSDAILLRSAR